MSIMAASIEPNSLEVLSNNRDLLRDLFTYLDYVSQRSIKRMTRTNQIPRADLNRLAKYLDIDPVEDNDWMYARPNWINFIDTLALNMHLVSYDLQGEYRSYNSAEASFFDNYVEINNPQLNKFLELTPAGQEKSILSALNQAKSNNRFDNNLFNEFFHYGPLGFLDSFDRWGSDTGSLEVINFPKAREFLLSVLLSSPVGEWLSTGSLIAYLKANHPYFLIPEKLPKKDRRGYPITRYDAFMEKSQEGQRDKPISPNDVDAFERVEGRYVERFLEYIPLLMRFVELAYNPKQAKGKTPSLGQLKAFRINKRFARLMSGDALTPKVTIQPNFDIVVESDFYPAAVIRQMTLLGEQMSSPNSGHGAYVGIFQLKKNAVAAALVQQPDLDVIKLLKQLSGRDLPSNVAIELDEWAGHADQFTLYEGFALLETSAYPAEIENFVSEKINPTLSLVSDPPVVFGKLETLGRVPLAITHSNSNFTALPESAVSLFPRETAAQNLEKAARQIKIARSVAISYQFPDKESFDAVCKTLAELRCPFHAEPASLVISIQQKEQVRFDEAIQKIQADFVIEIE